MSNETQLFLKIWLTNPFRVGTVAPSSPWLARAVARQVPLPATRPILELGGGTGAITKALLEVGVPPDRLIVVEREAALRQALAARFPELDVIQGDASDVVQLLARRGITEVGAVVSSLPLTFLPRPLRRRMVEPSFALLGPDRPFIQFTYSLFSPLPRRAFGVTGGPVVQIWRNFPPASVWVYRRRRD